MKYTHFILTADWHLRDTVPVCRTDDFIAEQWRKVQFIKDLSEKYDCPVIHSGDLFHHWKPSPLLLSMTIHYLPERFWTVYGNHDLPQNNLDEAEKSGVYTLWKAGKIKLINTHFGQPLKKSTWRDFIDSETERKIAVWHILTFKKELPFPGCEEKSAKELLRTYKKYDLIVTGDNHKTFVQELNGRLLVNPGSITRQTASQINHKPCVFLYRVETNTVEKIYLPVNPDAVSKEHIENIEKRNNRIDSFISSLNTDLGTEISFKKNLKIFYTKNKVKPKVKELITKFTEL